MKENDRAKRHVKKKMEAKVERTSRGRDEAEV